MNQIRETATFRQWRLGLGREQIAAKVTARLERLRLGNAGDCESVGESVSELRIDFGPGFRLYFTKIGAVTYWLLVGGDKSSQESDIKTAKIMANQLKAQEAENARIANEAEKVKPVRKVRARGNRGKQGKKNG